MARAIFISYRRDDSEGETGRLFDDLVRAFGDDSVFMDVAGIDPGTDFRTAIDSNVASCGVLLAVIGPHWAAAATTSGTRRLDDVNDFVRLEIASALKRNIAVIPVLVHDAKMPHPDELPDNLKDLSYRNSVELTHARWNSDVQLLTSALGQYVRSTRATDTKPVHATVSVQLPPPHDARPRVAALRSRKTAYVGLGTLALLAAIGAFFFVRHTGPATAPKPTPITQSAQSAVPVAAPPASAPAASAPASEPSAPAQSAPATSALIGTWLRSGMQAHNNIVQVTIAADGSGALTVQAWGYCEPANCSWGTQSATLSGSSAISHWQFSEPADRPGVSPRRSATMTVTPDNGNLDLEMDDVYANGRMRSFRYQFTRGT